MLTSQLWSDQMSDDLRPLIETQQPPGSASSVVSTKPALISLFISREHWTLRGLCSSVTVQPYPFLEKPWVKWCPQSQVHPKGPSDPGAAGSYPHCTIWCASSPRQWHGKVAKIQKQEFGFHSSQCWDLRYLAIGDHEMFLKFDVGIIN